MEIQTQTTIAAGTATAGTASASAVAATGSGNAKTVGTGDFNKALAALLNQGDKKTTDEASLLASLLQGLGALGLTALLPQLQAGESGALTGADAGKILEALTAHPELLATLANSPAGQQWFAQAGQMLASMGKNPPHLDLTQTGNQPQLQSFMELFVSALHEEPESPLLKQLAESFLNLGQPAAKQDTPTGAANAVIADQPRLKLAESFLNLGQPVAKQDTPTGAANAVIADQTRLTAPEFKTFHPAAVNAKGRKETNDTASPRFGSIAETVSPLQAMAAKSSLVYNLAVGNTAGTLPPAFATEGQSAGDILAGLNAEAVLSGKEDIAGQTASIPVQFSDLLKAVNGQGGLVNPLFPKPVSAQTFVQDMSQFVMKSLKVNPFTGTSEARLTLTPESLGQVDVKISMNNGQVVAHFVAQTIAGKEMLESQLPMLRQNLQQQGLQVDRLEVTQNNSLQSGMFQEQRQQQTFQQPSKQTRSAFTEVEAIPEDFSTEMAGILTERSAESGSSIDYTA